MAIDTCTSCNAKFDEDLNPEYYREEYAYRALCPTCYNDFCLADEVDASLQPTGVNPQ